MHEFEKADLVLITHGHSDHCSVEDLQKITAPGTIIFATPDCTSKFAGRIDPVQLKLVKPGEEFHLGNMLLETVPAYNTNKPFHSKANEYVGYILTLGGMRIYHAGDTDATPEMEELRADVALVPVSGTFVMNAEEAAAIVNKLKPKIAVPMHISPDNLSEAEKFKKLAKVQVEILV